MSVANAFDAGQGRAGGGERGHNRDVVLQGGLADRKPFGMRPAPEKDATVLGSKQS